jgi:hypothetical protein
LTGSLWLTGSIFEQRNVRDDKYFDGKRGSLTECIGSGSYPVQENNESHVKVLAK